MNNPQRYHALDIFRGMTIALMILVNTPGSWSFVYPPLRHAQWHGLTLTDLVFPFFLFIVGTAMMFSFSKYDFRRTKKVYQKIAKRTAIIFLIGLLGHLYGTLVHGREIENFRIMGVLQRIALCYGIAAVLVLRFKLQHLWIILIAALIGYWQLLLWNGGYELETNFARTVDMVILGSSHLYKGTGIPFDPEGLLSTIPSIMTVLLGFFAGVMIHSATDQVDNVKKMLILGALLIVTGWLWSFVFPINKQLWTSSYVLVTGGIAFMVLAALIWVIDINAVKKP
ncbi:MAG: heparan-alpha-glucosaminide N-acetyltransferase domain-containing protein, partial [Candidatus Marinimicrobia bacterium]|nr:heparan-alpha-glucosaminide N-acetyltransferase domain-containing protein [Candidatus Neomarinimicrobiota bacterium]